MGAAASTLGIANAAHSSACQYPKDRIVRRKCIGDYQAVAHRLANMAADIEEA